MLDGFLKKFDDFMTKLGRNGYESEHTKYMQDWMATHTDEAQTQASGRALWWDKKPVTADEAARRSASTVPVKAYYYQAD